MPWKVAIDLLHVSHLMFITFSQNCTCTSKTLPRPPHQTKKKCPKRQKIISFNHCESNSLFELFMAQGREQIIICSFHHFEHLLSLGSPSTAGWSFDWWPFTLHRAAARLIVRAVLHPELIRWKNRFPYVSAYGIDLHWLPRMFYSQSSLMKMWSRHINSYKIYAYLCCNSKKVTLWKTTEWAYTMSIHPHAPQRW